MLARPGPLLHLRANIQTQTHSQTFAMRRNSMFALTKISEFAMRKNCPFATRKSHPFAMMKKNTFTMILFLLLLHHPKQQPLPHQ